MSCLKLDRALLRRKKKRAAAMASPPTISYITANELTQLRPTSKLAIIDVRDEERSYDGHIVGSLHVASDSFTEQLPDLMKKIEGQQAVVFHCAKSQVRGPACAGRLVDHMSALMSNKEINTAPKVYVLEKGFNGWSDAGHPVCKCSQVHCKNC